jgi:hypothetical protein
MLRPIGIAVVTSILVLSLSGSASAYTIYSAEKSGFSKIPFSTGSATEDAFLNALSSPAITDNLDGLTPGSPTGQTLFGGLASISQSSPPAISDFGIYTHPLCYDSTQCIIGNPSSNPAFTISFSNPVESFGFWANDQNTFFVNGQAEDDITIVVNGGSVVMGPSAISGSASFYGFIASNRSELISSLEFFSGYPVNASLVFDQFTTSTAKPSVPGPTPILGTALAYGWSRQLRRRLKATMSAGDRTN